MTDLLTTPIKIAFIHPNGDRQPLGAGEISIQGEILLTETVAGQEEYLDDLVTELNNRSFLVVKEPPPEGADRFSIGKRKVMRDSDEFILQLAAYAERAYALDLEFDLNALIPVATDVELEVTPAPLREGSTDGPSPLGAGDDPGDIDPDAVHLEPAQDEPPAVRPHSPEGEVIEAPDDIDDGLPTR